VASDFGTELQSLSRSKKAFAAHARDGLNFARCSELPPLRVEKIEERVKQGMVQAHLSWLCNLLTLKKGGVFYGS
jgi:hypothetical protein